MNLACCARLMDMAATTFTGLITVAVPVADQDAAKVLYAELGFEATFDQELRPGFRWIDLQLPGGGTRMSLVRAGGDLPAGIDTGIRFSTGDAREAHGVLESLGLDVGALLEWDTAPPMFSFVDPDGNRFYVTETPN